MVVNYQWIQLRRAFLALMRLLVMTQQKYHMGYYKVECFSRTIIELMYQRFNLVLDHTLKTASFGKVLPYK